MTTTIRVKTYDWPVEATINDGGSTQQQTVPPNDSVDFHLTQTRSLSLKELPAPADQKGTAAGAASGGTETGEGVFGRDQKATPGGDTSAASETGAGGVGSGAVAQKGREGE